MTREMRQGVGDSPRLRLCRLRLSPQPSEFRTTVPTGAFMQAATGSVFHGIPIANSGEMSRLAYRAMADGARSAIRPNVLEASRMLSGSTRPIAASLGLEQLR